MDGGAIALAIIGLLNSGLAAGYYLRLALTAAQRDPDAAPATAKIQQPKLLAVVALLFAVGATLVLGIVPNQVLHAAQSAAHTLQAPPPDQSEPTILTMPPNHP